MTAINKFTLRLTIYGLALAYIACDILVFHGPLAKKIDEANPLSAQNIAQSKSRGVVARVFNLQITLDQLDRAVQERLWLSGTDPKSLSPELKKITRYAALNDLIDHELLRIKAKANAPQLIVTPEEIDTRLARFCARFSSRDAMLTAMKSEGLGDEQDLRDRLAARIQQEKYVALKIDPLVEVSDEEARAWFDQHQDRISNPERIELRHIFLAALTHPAEEAQQKLTAALTALTTQQHDFATLARELSEDESNKNHGGSLGWITHQRLPADFTKAAFQLPLRNPRIIQTHLGWHLMEVTDRKAAEPVHFESAKPQIIAALKTTKRQQAIEDFRITLRQFEAEKIDVFHDVLDR